MYQSISKRIVKQWTKTKEALAVIMIGKILTIQWKAKAVVEDRRKNKEDGTLREPRLGHREIVAQNCHVALGRYKLQ